MGQTSEINFLQDVFGISQILTPEFTAISADVVSDQRSEPGSLPSLKLPCAFVNLSEPFSEATRGLAMAISKAVLGSNNSDNVWIEMSQVDRTQATGETIISQLKMQFIGRGINPGAIIFFGEFPETVSFSSEASEVDVSTCEVFPSLSKVLNDSALKKNVWGRLKRYILPS
jgi:hypothetical protein